MFAGNLRLDASDTGDPAGCGATEVDAINLSGANNQVVASSPLVSPLDVMVPDFRPNFGTATGAAPNTAGPGGPPPYLAIVVAVDAPAEVTVRGPYSFRVRELSGTLPIDTT